MSKKAPQPLNDEAALELARSTALSQGWSTRLALAPPPMWLAPALQRAGLTPGEAQAVAAWHGMPTPAGIPDEFRQVKYLAEFWPEDTAFMSDTLTFWKWVDPGGNPYRFWTVRHAISGLGTPKSQGGKAALKLAQWVMEWARAHRPTPREMVEVINAREDRTQSRGKRRLISPPKPVRLYQVWSLEVSIRHALGEGGSMDPEVLSAELGPLVEVDCWRTSEAPASTGGMRHQCTLCGLVTTDGYGFCWGSYGRHSYTACPACQNSEALRALMEQWKTEPEEPRPPLAPPVAAPTGKRRELRVVDSPRRKVSPDAQPVVQKRLFNL